MKFNVTEKYDLLFVVIEGKLGIFSRKEKMQEKGKYAQRVLSILLCAPLLDKIPFLEAKELKERRDK